MGRRVDDNRQRHPLSVVLAGSGSYGYRDPGLDPVKDGRIVVEQLAALLF